MDTFSFDIFQESKHIFYGLLAGMVAALPIGEEVLMGAIPNDLAWRAEARTSGCEKRLIGHKRCLQLLKTTR